MTVKKVTPGLSVSPQISEQDISILAAQGFKGIINNRPDGESMGQPSAAKMADLAAEHGMDYRHIPIRPGRMTKKDINAFGRAMAQMKGPVLAHCRSGMRSISLWALSEAGHLSTDAILKTAASAGYNLSALRGTIEGMTAGSADTKGRAKKVPEAERHAHDVVIIGGGAGGIAAAASLLKRRADLDIAIIEPKEVHYYQPGWTLVGGGVFSREQTKRPLADVLPAGTTWLHGAVAEFLPTKNAVVLEDGEKIYYKTLVVAPGLKLDWDKVEGLTDTLGKNGVTSNYRFDLAPYTWELVTGLRNGRALFTQPPMPIKCAGAPQKAMYMACDHWRREGRLKDIDINFHLAGAALFGVADYVPALMGYIERYNAHLHYKEDLIAVDGAKKIATFAVTDDAGNVTQETREFDMLHVCPPQGPLDVMKGSPIADAVGWVAVNNETLQHQKYGNIFSLGDSCSAPNAKTAAAVRKQAPVVAHNVLAVLDGQAPGALYAGYGSCPLTVERGKVVLAEFGYGGKLQPTLPRWLIEGTKPSSIAWFLKEKLMPSIYFDLMLKGREWLAKPQVLSHAPLAHDASDACDFKDKK
ncbi:bifunctional protein tyrosine phosphatase family protein/NAD(P)/FAD-dependent oxidoreductase [Kordiimonas marina]|uniref:bifunctional protein tyrosine phosphatase family protein/NAD(P)/FAD-dependent oxidoreductase n=1 Tax=Kordiimonas marina TaxID=2872312 RepID=UPI001FF41A55|nr:bifunctional protein tyrosine phosphatase family protein/NAD(P)/FAD-dependent oxidoreductase [Kordiimonas marina]MCJ9429609.1 TIGR01244 family phosphatase [Kordiimonas marina]